MLMVPFSSLRRCSAYFQAFNFANSRQVITAVQANGQRLKHETSNYWSWSPTGKPIDPKVREPLFWLGCAPRIHWAGRNSSREVASFSFPTSLQGPFDFALLGANRQVLRVRVGQLRSQDLKVRPLINGNSVSLEYNS